MTGQTIRGLVLDGLALAGASGIVGGAWALDWRAGLIAAGALLLSTACLLVIRETRTRP